MLQNAYFLAKIGADTAENEQHFAEILPKIGVLGPAFVKLGHTITTLLARAASYAAGLHLDRTQGNDLHPGEC